MEKEPKFNVGDWVILRLGELKEITQVENVAEFGDSFYYEVEGRHQSVPESALEPYENDAYLFAYEFEYELGDMVTVDGYKGHYRIEAVSVETHISSEGESHEVIYQLRGDSGMISAVEEDMELIEGSPVIEFTPEDRKAPTYEERRDTLLDELNDYNLLYKTFGDVEYLARYEDTKAELSRLVQGGTA